MLINSTVSQLLQRRTANCKVEKKEEERMHQIQELHKKNIIKE